MSLVVDHLEDSIIENLPGDNTENADYLEQLAARLLLTAADLRGNTSPPTATNDDPGPALWFTADAVREHYDGTDALHGLTNEQIEQVGSDAWSNDGIYRAYGRALDYALSDVKEDS